MVLGTLTNGVVGDRKDRQHYDASSTFIHLDNRENKPPLCLGIAVYINKIDIFYYILHTNYRFNLSS